MKKEKFMRTMNRVEISPEAENRILLKCLKSNYEKEKIIMSKRKLVATAAAAVLVLGITAYAAGGIISSRSSSSSSKPEYTSLPSVEKCIGDIGYEPVLIEKFDNGYTFKEGSVMENSLDDETGKAVESFKSVAFTYTDGKNKLLFSQSRYTSETEDGGEAAGSCNGIDIYFTGYTNKIVPSGYTLTDEDKNAEASGELVFSYGSDKVSISRVNGVAWSIDNMHYGLTQIDGELTKAELVDMAKEAIEK